ncbi:MAG: DUF4920 domain-containing protein [Bryobacterales bacterium]|nr:DUF4920 domain-containing protein [Bryobacterales bacterium]
MRTLFPLFVCLAAAAAAAEVKLGKALTLNESQPVAAVLAKPEPLVGKVVQVRGKVTEVCQMMGCWMALADLDSAKVLRVKVNDGDIVFPKDSVGKVAVAEGTLSKHTRTRQQAVDAARHEAEEQGRKFNPKSIKSGTVVYQLDGLGAVIQ